MEICGGQTHTIVKSGLEDLLPQRNHAGPRPRLSRLRYADRTHRQSGRHRASVPDVIFCSFGDMLRVPGSSKSLFDAKAEGADVRIVYSPLDALKLAKANPHEAGRLLCRRLRNHRARERHGRVAGGSRWRRELFASSSRTCWFLPPWRLCCLPRSCVVQGFLAAGHVCTIMGYEEYFPIAEKYKVPIVVTGFEPLDILEGILHDGRASSKKAATKSRISTRARCGGKGIARRRRRIAEVFEIVNRGSGAAWARFLPAAFNCAGAFRNTMPTGAFPFTGEPAHESPECISGLILQGIKKPHECPAFAVKCTPENPLGAPMVSSEGACAAYYHYGRRQNHDRVQPELSGPASR